MEIIRTMIDRIEVHAGQERGKPDVILVGALAQIFSFTQQKQNAASYEDGGRVLMVAGARSHLYRTQFTWPYPRRKKSAAQLSA